MCLAIPQIIVSDFYANRSGFIVNMWFKFFSLPLQVFRPYFVVFLALGMFYFCEIPIQTLFCSLFGSWHVLFLMREIPCKHLQTFCQPWTITNRALRTICHKFLRSGSKTSLNCLKFPQIRPSLWEYSAGLKTCENNRKRTRLLPKKTHSENEGEKSSPKKS